LAGGNARVQNQPSLFINEHWPRLTPSANSPWLAGNKRIDIDVSVASFIKKCASYVQVLPITTEIAVRSVQFPKSYANDPQDRIIGATAIVESIRLLTRNKLIVRSGLVPLAL
jgi:PIN domain nuclease of toxin-antitoxin system